MLLSLLFLLPLSQAVTWYLARDLSHHEETTLTSSGCFRGTYGRFPLSIFTCEGVVKGEAFADLPSDAPLCVVEFDDVDPQTMIKENADALVLWRGISEVILTSPTGTAYPAKSCGSRSEYSGAALNVIRVPRSPVVPTKPLAPLEVAAPDARITEVLNLITATNLRNTVNQLTSYVTRYSYAQGSVDAANWAATVFTTAGFTVQKQTFDSTMCANTIAKKTGTTNPNDVILIGAHLDSRSGTAASSQQNAPGADDNGSGSALVLELAKAIASSGFTSQKSIYLALWCGEEQGLVGSEYYAVNKPAPPINIQAAYNADMIGYNCSTPNNRIAFMNRFSDPTLTAECKTVAPEYVTGLTSGDTSACCSDQQSFQDNGVPAVGVFECTGTGVAYPQYHTINDVADNLDYTQVQNFGRAVASCFLTRAVPSGLLKAHH